MKQKLWPLPLREIGIAGTHGLSKVLLLGLGVLFARVLGAEGYGVYAHAMAILSVLSVVAAAGIPTLVLREVAVAQKLGQSTKILVTLRRSFRLTGGISLVLLIVGTSLLFLYKDFIQPSVWLTNLAMLVLLPCTVLLSLHGYTLRGFHKVLTAQIIENIVRPLGLVLIALTMFWMFPESRAPEYAMAAQVLIVLMTLMISYYLVRRELPAASSTTNSDNSSGWSWIRGATPFTMISLAAVINSQTDMLMLGWLRTAEEVGLYRVAVQASLLVAFSLQVANVVIAPKIASMYASDQREALQELVTKSARLVLVFALPVAMVLMLYGGEIAAFLFGAEFLGSGAALVILAVGHLVNAAFGSVGILLNMTRYEKESAKTLWLSTLINVVLNAIFIPIYGIVGAAGATVASLCVWNILLFFQVQRRLGINSTAFRKSPWVVR